MARPVIPSASRESHAPGLFPAVAAPGGRPVHALPPAPAVRLALVPAFASLRFRMRWFQPSRTQSRGPRRCHSRCPSRFHSPLLTCGPFPPPALPGLSGSTDLSATLTGPACPLRDSGLARAHHRRGFPCCFRPPLTCMLSPVPRRSRPVLVSLASRPLTAFPVTSAGRPPHRLFRGLLGVHLITACMLAEPPTGDPFTAECFSPCRCLHEPLRLLPAGTTVRRAGFAPAGGQCLSTAHNAMLVEHALDMPQPPYSCQVPDLGHGQPAPPRRARLRQPSCSHSPRPKAARDSSPRCTSRRSQCTVSGLNIRRPTRTTPVLH